jgi:hypothetical protein
MAIVDGFNYWLMKRSTDASQMVTDSSARIPERVNEQVTGEVASSKPV